MVEARRLVRDGIWVQDDKLVFDLNEYTWHVTVRLDAWADINKLDVPQDNHEAGDYAQGFSDGLGALAHYLGFDDEVYAVQPDGP